jgi:hypothetical protein
MSGRDAVREALAELVALKNLKDRTVALHGVPPEYVEGMAEYNRRKPLAWAEARAALAAPPAAPAQPQAQQPPALQLAALVLELADAVDAAALDIGGHRPQLDILREAVAFAQKLKGAAT